MAPLTPPEDGLEPWGSNHHPSDEPMRHVEEVSTSRHPYDLHQGGTMDG